MWNKHRALWQWISLIVGIFLTAAPFPLLFLPNDIAPGGITGLATLISSLTGWPVGLLAALLNAPLFLISWRQMGRGFAVKSLIGMLGVSAVIDLLNVAPVTRTPMLAAVFGGVVMGVGVGLVIRGGATTGGSDMAATLIHKRFPVITVGSVLLALDCCVITASAFVFDIEAALYALIAVFLSARVMDRVVEGLQSAKAFFVFSAQTDEIADAVMDRLSRGATLLHAKGAYKKRENDVLLCVVSRLQIPQFKGIVQDIDPEAFVMVTDVREALGEGFTRPPAESGG